MKAFLDESGTNPETPVLSVAGFYGAEKEWAVFRNLWQPLSQDFHALRSTRLFPALCDAIEESKVNGIITSIAKSAYSEIATAHFKSFVGNPYAVCTFLTTLTICERTNQKTAFVLEQGQPNLEYVKRTIENMMDDGGWQIASVASAKKADFIELHPADFASHLSSSHDKPWMQRLFDSGRLHHGHVTREALYVACEEITKLISRAKRERKKADAVK